VTPIDTRLDKTALPAALARPQAKLGTQPGANPSDLNHVSTHPNSPRRNAAQSDESRHNPTKRNTHASRPGSAKTERHQTTEFVLSPVQLATIEKLLLGNTITETAAAVGVDRSTIHRWLKKDFEFQAELNRCHNSLTDSLDDKLLNIAIGSLPYLEKTIRRNVWAILALLKGVGALSGKRFLRREEDPREIAEYAAL